MLMIIYVCMYATMSLFDRVVKDFSSGGMISYACEWHEEIPGSCGIKWKSNHDKYMRSISRGYDLILCDYIVPMFML